MDLNTDHVIKTEDQLRRIYDQPHPMVASKGVPHLTKSIKRYIELSPFACLSTYDGKGRTDISPRGDAPGFVKIADDNTLLLPDRPGNNRPKSHEAAHGAATPHCRRGCSSDRQSACR